MSCKTANFMTGLIVVGLVCPIASADIINGNFENTDGWGDPGDPAGTQPVGWRDSTVSPARRNAAGQQSGVNAVGGSGTSAYMPADSGASGNDRRELTQYFSSPIGPDWQLQFDFAAQDPGDDGDRSLTGALLGQSGNPVSVIFRLVDVDADGDGDFQLYNGSSYVTIAALKDSVIFDPDVTLAPLVHTITFSADWSASTLAGRAMDITVRDSSGGVKTATGVTVYNAAPSQNHQLVGMNFTTYISTGDYLLDNVVVPEPGTLALLGLGGAVAVLRRRRRSA